MSKLEELVREFCPKGVKFFEIKQCVKLVDNIKWKEHPNEKYHYIDLTSVDRDTHSVVDTQIIDASNAPSRAQQIIQTSDIIFGATRPMLKRYCYITDEYNGAICSTGFCVLRPDTDKILPSWLYHNISSDAFFAHVEKFQKGASYPAISDTDVKAFSIPVPPLPVQGEIVRILDNFTELTAKLAAELAARKKQYGYYRDKCLSFTEVIPKVKLSEICKIGDGLHGTPKYSNDGEFYFINGNNLSNGSITFGDKTKKVDGEEYKRLYIDLNNAVLMSINGTIGNVALYNGEDIILGKSVAYFKIEKPELIDRDFLFHYLNCSKAINYYDLNLTGSTIKNLGLKSLRDFCIPLPPLDVQKRVVHILNNFDMLCASFDIGLPAEIEARKKQYEYYRDKLLTFQPAE